jgi:hypothetical protein
MIPAMRTTASLVAIVVMVVIVVSATAPAQSTFVAPRVYYKAFYACTTESPCSKTAGFTLKSVSDECCVLRVTNGNDNREREVSSYAVYLNGTRIVPTTSSRYTDTPVKISKHNTFKVVLVGQQTAFITVVLYLRPTKPK